MLAISKKKCTNYIADVVSYLRQIDICFKTIFKFGDVLRRPSKFEKNINTFQTTNKAEDFFHIFVAGFFRLSELYR